MINLVMNGIGADWGQIVTFVSRCPEYGRHSGHQCPWRDSSAE